MYKAIIRPALFTMPPERAHHFTFRTIKWAFAVPGVQWLCAKAFAAKAQPKEVLGLVFPNPVGLAAGFDKDAVLFNELAAFGFGFIEVGTLTPKAQPGNEQPRLFRLPADQAVINRMGFNNGGVEAAVQRLRTRKNREVIIGGNVGKNKVTPNENAVDDYLYAVEALHPVVDYFVVNVSSPNTPNLRELQEKEPLKALLSAVQEKNETLGARPLLLKIAPDLTQGQLEDIVDIVKELQLDGVIATNTTIDRSNLTTPAERVASMGAGGLSGAPVRARSTEVVRFLRNALGPKVAIIAVGGIFTGADAQEKLDAGADLVQVYTGFLYEGPAMVKRILKHLS